MSCSFLVSLSQRLPCVAYSQQHDDVSDMCTMLWLLRPCASEQSAERERESERERETERERERESE